VASTSSRYKAKVAQVAPLWRRDQFEQFDSCFLGVSLQNKNFTPAKVEGMAEWVARRFDRCTVLVGDSIHRLTLEANEGMAAEPALTEALRLGREFVDEHVEIFERFRDQTEFQFVTCSQVQQWPEYAGYHDVLKELFRRDEPFRRSVQAFGNAYHRKRYTDTSNATERAYSVQLSSDYFLEEFAVFGCLQRLGISVMVYPGSFSTLSEVVAGGHPGAPAELRELVVVSLQLRGR
jgi:tRNA-dependent cyclodipeptide synthase